MNTTARDYAAAAAVVAKLASDAPSLSAVTLSIFSGDRISVHLTSRADAQAWGEYLGSYREFTTAKYPSILTCDAEGYVDGLSVSAGCNVETCECGKPAVHLVADPDSGERACKVPW